MSGMSEPFYLHARAGSSAPALGSAEGVRVLGIEVTQVIQDMDHSVPLIAGKATVVRVYLDHRSLASATKVSGEISWQRSGGSSYLPAVNAMEITPASPRTLDAQRSEVKYSMNFRLPAKATAVGKLRLRLKRVFKPGTADLPIAADRSGVEVEFHEAPPLRIKVIGLRYKKDGRSLAPAAVDFAYLRSYLARAYPVARVEWSQIVVPADFTAPFGTREIAAIANAQIAAIRSREVSDGVDPHTHYFGLVTDDGGKEFMRGLAFDIPETPSPDVVASAPCGAPDGYAGDQDESYADWYGAHELAHTMGRYHPGYPRKDQDPDDKQFPFEDGQLSDTTGVAQVRFVGFDTGDPQLDFPMQALHGARFHDVMTYMENQWLSSHTYVAIFERLKAENE